MRLVLDTNIVVAAFLSRRGASNALLRLAVQRQFVPLASTALFVEYEDVLSRPEFLLDVDIRRADARKLIARFADLCWPVETYFKTRPILPDPTDEMVLEAAINGRAEAIVTHNIKDFVKAQEIYDVTLWRPAEALERLRS